MTDESFFAAGYADHNPAIEAAILSAKWLNEFERQRDAPILVRL
jgi:hypothetical protein